MSILTAIQNWVSPKQPPPLVVKNWRTGMWVMYQDKLAILTKIDSPCEIHYADKTTGENIGTAYVPIDALRQARWAELPTHRPKITPEQGKELGYGA